MSVHSVPADDPRAVPEGDWTLNALNQMVDFGHIHVGGVAAELKMVTNGLAASVDGVLIHIPIDTIEKIVDFAKILNAAAEELT